MDYLYSFSGFVARFARMKKGRSRTGVPLRPRWRTALAYFAVTVTGTFSCAVKPLLSSATTFSV